jgi:hypothetical protein
VLSARSRHGCGAHRRCFWRDMLFPPGAQSGAGLLVLTVTLHCSEDSLYGPPRCVALARMMTFLGPITRVGNVCFDSKMIVSRLTSLFSSFVTSFPSHDNRRHRNRRNRCRVFSTSDGSPAVCSHGGNRSYTDRETRSYHWLVYQPQSHTTFGVVQSWETESHVLCLNRVPALCRTRAHRPTVRPVQSVCGTWTDR